MGFEIFGLLWLFILLIGLAMTAFWIWALVDCINHLEGNDRLIWVLVIIFLHGFGALLYLLIARDSARRRFSP